MIGARLLVAPGASLAVACAVGCGGSSPPAPATAKPQAQVQASARPAATPNGAVTPFAQPASCPAPLTWEDGTAIANSLVCADEPAFFFHEGACCRYPNGCVAPEASARYEKLEECETTRQLVAERAKRTPVCKADELVWQPSFCVFAGCTLGQFVTPERRSADCQRPLGLVLNFELDQKELSTNQLGRLENLATMANVLGVGKLRVEGQQGYDEKPDEKAKTPLSVQRANTVRAALTRVTRIPIDVDDRGTIGRARGRPELFRQVEVTMAPLADDHVVAQTTPFTLPWTPCESSVTFRTQIALTKHDGAVLVEVCRDKACSRGVIDSSYWAAWPGSGGEAMKGDFAAWLTLKETRQQLIRNGLNALKNGGVPGESDGETPASFHLELSFRDAAIRESSLYKLRLLRRRTEVALEWSGKLPFERVLRHPTRDPEPCLRAELAIPRTEHSLR